MLEFGVNVSNVQCEDQIMIHLEVMSGNVTYKTEPKTWFTVQGCGDYSDTTASVSCQKQSPEDTTLSLGTVNRTDNGLDTHMPNSSKRTFNEKLGPDVPTSTKPETTEATNEGQTYFPSISFIKKLIISQLSTTSFNTVLSIFIIYLLIFKPQFRTNIRIDSSSSETSSSETSEPSAQSPDLTNPSSEFRRDSQFQGVNEQMQSIIDRPSASENIETSLSSTVTYPSDNVSPENSAAACWTT